ncbi:DNA repair protein RecO [Balneola sp. MJW-20]|uniref:DNA repair protein RecO n=1 Tax=Gracilimonas aurantiaca TaxID=3234185 RepID=UPI003465E3C1
MVETAKVIVLRSIDYQDSSKIVTVLSDTHGKMALIAKGAKRPKNKLAGVIEPGAILEAVYYYKANRGVQTLSEASTIYRSMNFRMDIEKASILYSTLELINQLVHENEVNQPIFDFSEQFIPWLGDLDETKAAIFPYVQIRLAELTGVGLRVLADKDEAHYLNISNGSVDDQPLEELSYKLRPNQAAFLVHSIESKNSKIFNMPFDNGELKQLIHHLDVYFKYHVEGFKDRRSDAIFEQMIQ